MATSERLSVRLHADTMSELRNAAMADQRTVAQVARLALDRWAADRRLSVRGAQKSPRGEFEPTEEGVASDPFG